MSFRIPAALLLVASSVVVLLLLLLVSTPPSVSAASWSSDYEDEEEKKLWETPKREKKQKKQKPVDLQDMDLNKLTPKQIQKLANQAQRKQQQDSLNFISLLTPQPKARLERQVSHWTAQLKMNHLNPRFYVVDDTTLIFSIFDQTDVLEVARFVLQQPNVRNVKVGNREYTPDEYDELL